MENNKTPKEHNPPRCENELQRIIAALKEQGATQTETIKFLITNEGLSLRAADRLVLTSEAWQKERPANEALREAFDRILFEE